MTESRKPVALWWLGLLTLAYFLAGKLGLSLAVVNESVSPVWPPTGIAFASFLLLGPRIWPAIFAGAFLVNVTTTGSIATSIGIALGNTFEGRLGADLVRIFANGRDVFNRSRDVFKFVVLGGLFSTTVSATIGASILTLGGNANWREYPAIWFTWWLGDAVGALVVGPVLVLWSARIAVPRSRTRQLEGVGLFATVIAVGILVFYGFVGQPLTFLCLPPLVWAAFRFGQRETAAAIAILSGLAIWGTVRGLGPFADGPPNESLLLLQAFLGTIAVMSMLIAAVVTSAWAWRRGADALALAPLVGALAICVVMGYGVVAPARNAVHSHRALAATLDGLLERLAAGLRREQRFSTELSHELRTPLARVIAQAEVALRQPRPLAFVAIAGCAVLTSVFLGGITALLGASSALAAHRRASAIAGSAPALAGPTPAPPTLGA